MANLTRRPWDLRRGIDRLFDDFFSEPFASGFSGQGESEMFRPSLELTEHEGE